MPDEDLRAVVAAVDAQTLSVTFDPKEPWGTIYLTRPQAKDLIAALWRGLGEVQILRA